MNHSSLRPGRFDFGLTGLQEERALKLHCESIVFDLLSQHAGGAIFEYYPENLQREFHSRIATIQDRAEIWREALYWPYELSELGKSDLLKEWFRIAGLTCGTFSDIRVHDGRDPRARDGEERIMRIARLPWLRFSTTAAEIRSAKRDGLIAFYANCQPAIAPPQDLNAFDSAYEKGLRSFMLTYNRMDSIGVGCTERVDAGLSMFGVEVVKHCNRIGMIVDVSHCGHLTTMDACRHSKNPVTANHTAARGVYDHARGKSDVALRAIAKTGGIIGVVAVPFFLSGEHVPTIEHMLDHIDYIADLVGWRHVAIGTDWPLQAPDDILLATFGAELQNLGFRGRDHVDVTQRLVGFADCRDLLNITRGLVKRGYNDQQIKGILGENALRVFESVCG